MSELQNIWKKKTKKKVWKPCLLSFKYLKKQEQFENHVWYPLSTDKCGAAEYYESYRSLPAGEYSLI